MAIVISSFVRNCQLCLPTRVKRYENHRLPFWQAMVIRIEMIENGVSTMTSVLSLPFVTMAGGLTEDYGNNLTMQRHCHTFPVSSFSIIMTLLCFWFFKQPPEGFTVKSTYCANDNEYK